MWGKFGRFLVRPCSLVRPLLHSPMKGTQVAEAKPVRNPPLFVALEHKVYIAAVQSCLLIREEHISRSWYTLDTI